MITSKHHIITKFIQGIQITQLNPTQSETKNTNTLLTLKKQSYCGKRRMTGNMLQPASQSGGQ